MVNVVQYNVVVVVVVVVVVGYEISFPWVVVYRCLVTVRVYPGGPSAVSLLGYFLVVWFVGSLCGIVSGPVYEVQWR